MLTGGYGILGACMAKHLAREGAYVVILGRNEQKGSALVNEIKAEGGEALFLVSNVLDKALLEQNKQEILKAYGKIDVLVNLAVATKPERRFLPTRRSLIWISMLSGQS